MTEIKTAQAWGLINDDISVSQHTSDVKNKYYDTPVVIVHGLTDAGYTYDIYKCGNLSYYTNIRERPNYCPSCGRKVEVK